MTDKLRTIDKLSGAIDRLELLAALLGAADPDALHLGDSALAGLLAIIRDIQDMVTTSAEMVDNL